MFKLSRLSDLFPLKAYQTTTKTRVNAYSEFMINSKMQSPICHFEKKESQKLGHYRIRDSFHSVI